METFLVPLNEGMDTAFSRIFKIPFQSLSFIKSDDTMVVYLGYDLTMYIYNMKMNTWTCCE
jgi:hypothetical protein